MHASSCAMLQPSSIRYRTAPESMSFSEESTITWACGHHASPALRLLSTLCQTFVLPHPVFVYACVWVLGRAGVYVQICAHVCLYMRVGVHAHMHVMSYVAFLVTSHYGVATISRLLKSVRLLWKRAL